MENKVAMEREASHFREMVHAYGKGAYADLIHNLKTISCRLISDLVGANEWVVLESIRRHDGFHFICHGDSSQ